ncbi:MAG TPA: PilZ domain-containing protein [Bryobacteraceae bacterium]|nr:PilZ domain-containing protein [Bryobacteraceae bacterium]
MQAGVRDMTTNIGSGTDRRGTSRYPVREEVKYRIIQARSPKTVGTGTTLNIGSGGILFTTEEKLPMGRMVELAVNWPARLGGTCPLKFVATGRVVRSEDNMAAVRIERYEFRTRGANGLMRDLAQ